MTQIEKIRAVLDSGMSETQKIEVIRDVVKASDTSLLDAFRELAQKQPKQVTPFYVPYPVYPPPPPHYARPWAVPMEITCGTSGGPQ